MKEDYQKALKKLIIYIFSNPVSFNGQSHQKQKEPGTSKQSLFRLQDKFRQIPSLVIHYLSQFDDIKYSSFWVVPKITSASFCKPVPDIINYFTSIYPFEFANCWKEGEKIQKFEYLEIEKSFLDEIKSIFYSFWKAIV